MEVTTALCVAFVTYIIYSIFDYIIRIPKLRKMDDKYILITGCDTGFGHIAAKRFDKMGCHVFACCLTEQGEIELQKSCSDRLQTVYLDVSESSTIEKAYIKVQDALPKNKGLWGILNNAGILGKVVPEEWLHLKDYQQILDVNLLGLINVTMTFLPLVKRGGCGRIVNTSSMVAKCAIPKMTPYSISKYGVEAFSDSLRRQMAMFNISVHLIQPGGFRTQIADTTKGERVLRNAWNEAPKHAQEEWGIEFIEEMLTMAMKKNDTFLSERLTDVVDAYEHGLFGVYPRIRYSVGFDAKMLIAISQWMPVWITDWLMRKAAFDIVPKALRNQQGANKNSDTINS